MFEVFGLRFAVPSLPPFTRGRPQHLRRASGQKIRLGSHVTIDGNIQITISAAT